MVAMINTYLDVLRLEAGARSMRKETFQIGCTIEQVARVVQPIAQASEIKVRTEFARYLPALHGDPHLIEGALLNLVSNAIKFSARGSEVMLRAQIDGNGVILEVRSEEHTSELQSRLHLVCRLLLEKKKKPAVLSRPRLFHRRLHRDRDPHRYLYYQVHYL